MFLVRVDNIAVLQRIIMILLNLKTTVTITKIKVMIEFSSSTVNLSTPALIWFVCYMKINMFVRISVPLIISNILQLISVN